MKIYLATILMCLNLICLSQTKTKTFTRAGTLRGSITSERAWWDVLRYEIWVKPDFEKKFIQASNTILYKVTTSNHSPKMQIDLQPPVCK